MKTRIAIVLAAALLACRDDAKEADQKAKEARIEAEYRAREEQRAADEKARGDRLATAKADQEHALAIAKEKNETRADVQEYVSSLDKYLAQLARGTKESKNGDDRRGLLAFKTTLEKDLGDIDRASDADWPSVKARVEKDIHDAKQRISDLGLVAKGKA
jgi:hypothetical protein